MEISCAGCRLILFAAQKKFLRNFAKPLDKSLKMCYNIYSGKRNRHIGLCRKGEAVYWQEMSYYRVRRYKTINQRLREEYIDEWAEDCYDVDVEIDQDDDEGDD